jgi:hypothetical protein
MRSNGRQYESDKFWADNAAPADRSDEANNRWIADHTFIEGLWKPMRALQRCIYSTVQAYIYVQG